jgi:hypothetical protein
MRMQFLHETFILSGSALVPSFDLDDEAPHRVPVQIWFGKTTRIAKCIFIRVPISFAQSYTLVETGYTTPVLSPAFHLAPTSTGES